MVDAALVAAILAPLFVGMGFNWFLQRREFRQLARMTNESEARVTRILERMDERMEGVTKILERMA